MAKQTIRTLGKGAGKGWNSHGFQMVKRWLLLLALGGVVSAACPGCIWVHSHHEHEYHHHDDDHYEHHDGD